MNLGGQCCRGGRRSRLEGPGGDGAGKSSFWEDDLLRRAGGRWKAWGRGVKPGERSEWSLQVIGVLKKESSYGDGGRVLGELRRASSPWSPCWSRNVESCV